MTSFICMTLKNSGTQHLVVGDPQNRFLFILGAHAVHYYYYNAGFGDQKLGHNPIVKKPCFTALLNTRFSF